MIKNYPVYALAAAINANTDRKERERRIRHIAEHRHKVAALLFGEAYHLAGFVCRSGAIVEVRQLDDNAVVLDAGQDRILVGIRMGDDYTVTYAIDVCIDAPTPPTEYMTASVPDVVIRLAALVGQYWLDPDAARTNRVQLDPMTPTELRILKNALHALECSVSADHEYGRMVRAMEARFDLICGQNPDH